VKTLNIELWQLLAIGALFIGALTAIIWMALMLGRKKRGEKVTEALLKTTEQDVEHIFNQAFREELRNRGRLHFEKIIGENAMFLQQDLRLTTSQINEFMKQEISRTLQEEFKKYEESIMDAKQIAVDSIEKTRVAIEQQRDVLSTQLQQELKEEKARYIARLEKNMAEIINHYILAAIGDQISLDDQLEYILSDLEANKKEILEDIKNGA
jgi:hypothetical protein